MRLAAPLAALALSACASMAPPPESRWAGRFSATARLPERVENLSGGFVLQQSRGATALDLSSALGTTLLRVEQDAAGARASAANGLTLSGPDADALAQELTGVRLPVSGLPHWIDGRPAPGRGLGPVESAGAAGRFRQDGWTVTVLERGEAGLPRRVELERPAAEPYPALRVLLLIDERSGRAGAAQP